MRGQLKNLRPFLSMAPPDSRLEFWRLANVQDYLPADLLADALQARELSVLFDTLFPLTEPRPASYGVFELLCARRLVERGIGRELAEQVAAELAASTALQDVARQVVHWLYLSAVAVVASTPGGTPKSVAADADGRLWSVFHSLTTGMLRLLASDNAQLAALLGPGADPQGSQPKKRAGRPRSPAYVIAAVSLYLGAPARDLAAGIQEWEPGSQRTSIASRLSLLRKKIPEEWWTSKTLAVLKHLDPRYFNDGTSNLSLNEAARFLAKLQDAVAHAGSIATVATSRGTTSGALRAKKHRRKKMLKPQG